MPHAKPRRRPPLAHSLPAFLPSLIADEPAASVLLLALVAIGTVLGQAAYTSLAQLNAAGIPNDWMSSLRVPAGWTVQVYENSDFTGTMWTFTADTSLIPQDANDRMSSVKIFAQ